MSLGLNRVVLACWIVFMVLGRCAIATAQDSSIYFDGSPNARGRSVGSVPIQGSTWEFWCRLDQVDPSPGGRGWTVGWEGYWSGTPAIVRTDGAIEGASGWGPHNPTTNGPVALPSGTLGVGEWHHIAAVFGSGCTPGFTLYFDGQLVVTYGPGTYCPTSAYTVLGSIYGGTSFRGRIDEFRVSTVARYTGSFTPQTRFQVDASTWALWHFDEGTGSAAIDSVSGRVLTLAGGYQWKSGVGVPLFIDSDHDGHGVPPAVCIGTPSSCGLTLSQLSDDCDDGNALRYPGAFEVLDGLDNDCDGSIDDGFIGGYCTAGTTTNGCTPSMAWSGTPSASAASGFQIICAQSEGDRYGLILYGMAPAAVSWAINSTSLVCVAPPQRRTGAYSSGGTIGTCTGTYSLDFNAFMQSDPGALGSPFSAGQVFYAQAWFRDNGAPKGTNLSNGLRFTLAP